MSGNNYPESALIKHGKRVQIAYSALTKGAAGLSNLPAIIEQIGDNEMWRQFVHPETGMVFENGSFAEFVISSPPKGLGTDRETLERLCYDDKRVLSKVDGWLTQRPGNPNGANQYQGGISDIITNSTADDRGTSATYALRKLKKDAPHLLAQVLDGEMSPHAAMVEAGFRKRRISILIDPESAARSIKRNFTDDQVSELVHLLR